MPLQLTRQKGHWQGRFKAMASPCEILVEVQQEAEARVLCEAAEAETRRIETKFSRYRDDNIVHLMNDSSGQTVTVDEETADLLDFAHRCHEISGGRFDITSGVLRRIWKFDGSDRVPSRKQAKALLPLVGWPKITWHRPNIIVPVGMEIDLGGLGKEYAVDKVATLLAERTTAPLLVNFGGDLRAVGRRPAGRSWQVGVELPGIADAAGLKLELGVGALATSGDARRFLLRGGIRYPHILNPRTGWPVMRAPRSVTVLGDTCTEAGLLATLAMLHGDRAEKFLAEQGVRNWVMR
jgi:thiamine biosynthesis lipoprotein